LINGPAGAIWRAGAVSLVRAVEVPRRPLYRLELIIGAPGTGV
jgi:hypothetical protein